MTLLVREEVGISVVLYLGEVLDLVEVVVSVV
jgi:hypothetical protein